MKELEKLIQENRAFFDQHEPAEGHLERFRQKLGMASPAKKPFPIYRMARAAALVVLVLLSSLWLYEHLVSPPKTDQSMTLGALSPEMREVEFYYTSLINSKYREIEEMEFMEDHTAREMLEKEMHVMDSVYLNLQKELAAHPGDERVVSAIIEHYDLKVKVISYMLSQMKEIHELYPHNQKQTGHESTEI